MNAHDLLGVLKRTCRKARERHAALKAAQPQRVRGSIGRVALSPNR